MALSDNGVCYQDGHVWNFDAYGFGIHYRLFSNQWTYAPFARSADHTKTLKAKLLLVCQVSVTIIKQLEEVRTIRHVNILSYTKMNLTSHHKDV